MNFKTNVNLISNFLHITTTKTKVVLQDQFNNFVEIPYKWIDDIKHLEFNELLASSLGPLAIYFGWKKKHKEQFGEIASGSLSSSLVNGDPITTLVAISILAYRYSEIKNVKDLRNLKWGIIKGGTSIGACALTFKVGGFSIISFLVGICLVFSIRKSVTILRLFEYIKFLKKLKFKFPHFKKVISRRDFLTLKLFTYNLNAS